MKKEKKLIVNVFPTKMYGGSIRVISSFFWFVFCWPFFYFCCCLFRK